MSSSPCVSSRLLPFNTPPFKRSSIFPKNDSPNQPGMCDRPKKGDVPFWRLHEYTTERTLDEIEDSFVITASGKYKLKPRRGETGREFRREVTPKRRVPSSSQSQGFKPPRQLDAVGYLPTPATMRRTEDMLGPIRKGIALVKTQQAVPSSSQVTAGSHTTAGSQRSQISNITDVEVLDLTGPPAPKRSHALANVEQSPTPAAKRLKTSGAACRKRKREQRRQEALQLKVENSQGSQISHITDVEVLDLSGPPPSKCQRAQAAIKHAPTSSSVRQQVVESGQSKEKEERQVKRTETDEEKANKKKDRKERGKQHRRCIRSILKGLPANRHSAQNFDPKTFFGAGDPIANLVEVADPDTGFLNLHCYRVPSISYPYGSKVHHRHTLLISTDGSYIPTSPDTGYGAYGGYFGGAVQTSPAPYYPEVAKLANFSDTVKTSSAFGAEITALACALLRVVSCTPSLGCFPLDNVIIKTDAQSLVRELVTRNSEFRTKPPKKEREVLLAPVQGYIDLLGDLDVKVHLWWVPRERNTHADKLAFEGHASSSINGHGSQKTSYTDVEVIEGNLKVAKEALRDVTKRREYSLTKSSPNPLVTERLTFPTGDIKGKGKPKAEAQVTVPLTVSTSAERKEWRNRGSKFDPKTRVSKTSGLERKISRIDTSGRYDRIVLNDGTVMVGAMNER